MEKKVINALVAFVSFIFLECEHPHKHYKWVDYEMEIDSVYVSKRATRGAFIINDTLGLTDAFYPFDDSVCDHLEMDPRSLDLKGQRNKYCTIFDAKVPFWIHKRAGSDTLFLVQNHQTFLFRVPEDCCGDSEDYWNWD